MSACDTPATIRENAGLDQEEAAGKLGIDASTLSRIETGATKRLDAHLVTRMGALYGVCPLLLIDAHRLAVERRAERLAG